MASERLQRQIDRLLDEAEAAITELNWGLVRDRALAVLGIDPENNEGRTFLATAERALLGSTETPPSRHHLFPPFQQINRPPLPMAAMTGRWLRSPPLTQLACLGVCLLGQGVAGGSSPANSNSETIHQFAVGPGLS
jgi:hypothetical protein